MTDYIAYSPASLSLIFRKHMSRKYIHSGSTGVGFTLDRGVKASLRRADYTKIFLNGSELSFPTVETTIRYLTKRTLCVYLDSPLPLGYGFGISSAASLATAYAVNHILKLGKSDMALNRIVHRSEIDNHTGLGSTGTQVLGGFVVKNRAGMPPGYFRMQFTGTKLFTIILDKIETPSILQNDVLLSHINLAADRVMERLQPIAKSSFSHVIRLSYEFAKESRLIDEECLNIINRIYALGGAATLSMIGRVIISTVKPKEFEKKFRIEQCTISADTARLLI